MSRFAPPHCCTDSSAAPLPRKTRRFWYALPKNSNGLLTYWIHQRHVLQVSLMMQEGKALGKSKWRKIFLIKPVVPHLMLLYSRGCCKSRNSHFALLPYWFSQAITTSDYMLCPLSFKICFFFLPFKIQVVLCHFSGGSHVILCICPWHAPACASLSTSSRKPHVASHNSKKNKHFCS